MATTRYLRTQHLGWQDEQHPSHPARRDAATTVPVTAFCGAKVYMSDILWLERPLTNPLSVDTADMCQGCIAEWVERRLMHPVNVTHTSLGRTDGRALCGASKTYQTYARVAAETSCHECLAILRGSS